MSLRRKLLLLALIALVLPASGWLLLRELEDFLRQGQQQALQATARTIGRSLASGLTGFKQVSERDLLLSEGTDVAVDGYFSNWPEDYWKSYTSDDGALTLRLAGRRSAERLWLGLVVEDESSVRQNLAIEGAMDGVELSLFGSSGMTVFTIAAAATGPLTLVSEQNRQISGYWLDTFEGYRIELSLPWQMASSGVSLRVVDVEHPGVRLIERVLEVPRLKLLPRLPRLAARLEALLEPGQRAWLLDPAGNIRAAASGDRLRETTRQASWLARLFHEQVSRNLPVGAEVPLSAGRLPPDYPEAGWSRSLEDGRMLNTVTVPVMVEGRPVARLQLQSRADDLLLLSNQALFRILGISLLAMLLIMLAMYLYAGRLSARVRRLNRAVNRAREKPQEEVRLPLLEDRDELGELARADAGLLQSVREYDQYLRTLASKLSHELKTPLVIVRSSLENLAREPRAENAATYIQRAQEGSERLAGILRAMSDAGRLEQAIAGVEMENFDVAALLRQSRDAYAQIYPRRRLELDLQPDSQMLYGAPELLAQALDKLVDNADSFTGPDDVIRLGLRQSDDRLEISVFNTGSELPAAMRDSLFESLVSLRENRRDGVPHLGLGLYLVKLIATAHRGRAEAENLDAGVVFRLVLPSGQRASP